MGRGEFAIEAWLDVYASFRQELVKKLGAGVPVELELQEMCIRDRCRAR